MSLPLRFVAIVYFTVALAIFVALVTIPDPGDDSMVFYGGMSLLAGFSFIGGVVVGRWAACCLAGVAWLAALATDLLWAIGALDRSEEYEPYPVSFVIAAWDFLFLPTLLVLTAAGVAARRWLERDTASARTH